MIKRSHSLLRTISLLFAYTGLGTSLACMYNEGQHQQSLMLIILFTVWVSSPFLALTVIDIITQRWPYKWKRFIYYLAVLMTIFSLLFYSGALEIPGTRPAFSFLMVPLASWIIVITVLLWLLSRVKKESLE